MKKIERQKERVYWKENVATLIENCGGKDNVGEKAGVSQSTISNLIGERKDAKPTFRTLDKVLRVLGVSYADVFCDPKYVLSPKARSKFPTLQRVCLAANDAVEHDDPVFLIKALEAELEHLKKISSHSPLPCKSSKKP